MSVEESNKVVNDALHKLGEHFDAVQILATRTEQGNTLLTSRGTGNFYARIGMAHEFIESDKAQEQAVQLAAKLQQPPEEET